MAKAREVPASNGQLRSLVSGVEDSSQMRLFVVQALQEEFPLVAEALAGAPATATQPELPPGTITFWLDGSTMKFTYSVRVLSQTFFGVVKDVLNPWASVHYALLMGDVSRKRHTKQETTLAELEKLGKIY